MTHHQTPRDLPHKPSRRDDNLPIGRLGHKRDDSLSRIGADVYAALMIENTLLVAVSDDHLVFAVDPAGLRAQAIADKRPGWIVGTYTRRCGVGAIQRDMREHLRLMKVAA